MSDFGFDAYALGDLDPTEASNPLEIARDLIAAGKPRSALEVLAEHQKRLADDPEYLILCGDAWHAAGDAARAQHAFLGAIRLAPEDPRPLQLLGDVLVERGEKERARRVFEKAERLELAETDETEGFEDAGEATPHDLIAAAQRDERTRHASVSPKRLFLVGAVILGIGLLMSLVALLVTPESVAPEAAAPSPEAQVVPPKEIIPPQIATPPSAAPISIPEVPAVVEPIIDAPKPASRATRRATKPNASRKARETQNAPPSTPSPTEADVDSEVASSNDVAALTARADKLAIQGQTGTAAKFYRRALEIDPDYAPALVGMGRSLLRAEKYAEVMGNATRGLQLARGVDSRPGLEAEALYQIGRVHHQRGEEDAARRLLRQSTSLPGAPADAWFYLGESLSRDNSPAARDAYEQYLERKPNGHLSDRAHRAIQ